MTETLLAAWQSAPKTDTAAVVIPDGCRDLIMRLSPGKKPRWFVSSLEDHTYAVSIKAGVIMNGFRLKPGARINEERLLASVHNRHLVLKDIYCRIASFTHLSPPVVEALECLASDVGSVAQAAKQLGMSQRSLQRLLIRETGRSPKYWMLLARVRKSARTTLEPLPLAEIAAMYGYADQAHMSREHKRWLNTSPSKLRQASDMHGQLNELGYG